MSLNHAKKQIVFHQFRGVNFTTDPTELPPYLASNALNVDFLGETFRVRNGRSAYNGTAPTASRVRGAGAFYHSNGTRYLLMQAGTGLYCDRNGDGDFADANETLATGLTGGVPCDIWQVRNRVYAGSSADVVRYWDGSASTASAVALLTAPSAPTLSIQQTVLEDFEDHTEWTLVAGPGGGSLAKANDTAKFVEGAKSLQITANASNDEGAYAHRTFGATIDLSTAAELTLWVRGNRAAASYQVAIYRDGETPGTTPVAWELFPIQNVETAGDWALIRVPLSTIAPTSRDAVPGMALRYIDDDGAGYGSTVDLWFDSLMARCHLPGDRYTYYLTYANTSTGQESPPSTAAVIDVDIEGTQPARSVLVATVATNQSGVDAIRIYRRRENGPFSRARMIYELGNTFGADETKADTRDEGSLAADPDAYELVESKEVPPKAATYCVVGKRLLAGNITASPTSFPYRIYLSRYGYVEEFRSQDSPTDDPYGAGWIDIPSRGAIRRIVDFNGMAVIFTDRDIWTLAGSVWGLGEGALSLQKRASVGLDAREAVAVAGELIYFLSGDGVRVLSPNWGVAGEFRTWVISEPLELQYLTSTERSEATMGVDRNGRVYFEEGADARDCYVFDPRIPGALESGYHPLRTGWTVYGWPGGHSCYLRLRYGSGDEGQLLAGDYATGKLWYIGHGSTGAEISTDAGSAISWTWQAPTLQAPPGYRITPLWVHVTKNDEATEGFLAGVGTPDTGASTSQTLSGGGGTGTTYIAKSRWPASLLGRQMSLYLSRDDNSLLTVRHTVYEVAVGLGERM